MPRVTATAKAIERPTATKVMAVALSQKGHGSFAMASPPHTVTAAPRSRGTRR